MLVQHNKGREITDSIKIDIEETSKQCKFDSNAITKRLAHLNIIAFLVEPRIVTYVMIIMSIALLSGFIVRPQILTNIFFSFSLNFQCQTFLCQSIVIMSFQLLGIVIFFVSFKKANGKCAGMQFYLIYSFYVSCKSVERFCQWQLLLCRTQLLLRVFLSKEPQPSFNSKCKQTMYSFIYVYHWFYRTFMLVGTSIVYSRQEYNSKTTWNKCWPNYGNRCATHKINFKLQGVLSLNSLTISNKFPSLS